MPPAVSKTSFELGQPANSPPQLDLNFHSYWVGEERWPGVSEILAGAGLIDISGIPEDRLEYARVRGQAAHLACHYFDLGVLNWDTVDPAIVGYVRSYIALKERADYEVLGSELSLASQKWKFCGTLDKLARFNGVVGVGDLKTPVISKPATRFQTAGYHILACENWPDLKPRKRFEIKLKADGSIAELIPFTDLEEDVQGFLWANGLHHLKLKHKIIGG